MAKRHPSQVTRICETCNKPFVFFAYPSVVKKGHGRFCSKDCQKAWQTVPLAERFWRHVGPPEPNGCILWTGAVSIGGYGVIGSGTSNGRMIYANRVVYELLVGPIPPGLFACHSCDTPRCVNISHIFLGNRQENMDDMVAKGRQAKGERHGIAKLDEAKVLAIRTRYAQGGISHEQLAADYGVSRRTIGFVLSGATWTHI